MAQIQAREQFQTKPRISLIIYLVCGDMFVRSAEVAFYETKTAVEESSVKGNDCMYRVIDNIRTNRKSDHIYLSSIENGIFFLQNLSLFC